MLWIVLTIWSSAMDGLLLVDGRETLLNSIINVQIGDLQGTGVLAIPLFIGGFVSSMPSLIVWNYPWLNTDVGFFVKLVFLYPVSLAFIVAFILMIVTITQSKIGTIAVLGGAVGAVGATLLSLFS
jgi:hypothetical protein